jgi:NAD(P)-dependent dehydrogenase (short-subunit alcohol dehydrogenase family)
MNLIPNEDRKTLLLTGASRGIGHATVKRFSSAGWRVISCSRQAFPDDCPWEARPENHIQVDLADPDSADRAIAEIKDRLKPQAPGLEAECAGQQRRHLAQRGGRQAVVLPRYVARGLAARLSGPSRWRAAFSMSSLRLPAR